MEHERPEGDKREPGAADINTWPDLWPRNRKKQRWTSTSRTIYWTGLLRGTLAPHRRNQDPLPPPPTILCGGCSGPCRAGEEGEEAKTGPGIPNCPAPRGGARGSWGGLG